MIRSYGVKTSGWGAATVAAIVACPALSQDAGAIIDAEEIVVTGFRAQNRLAVDAKRDSDIIGEFLGRELINGIPKSAQV